MTVKPSSQRHAVSEFAGVLLRWFLGAVFLYLGCSKALHPVLFLKLLRQYELTDNHCLLNLIAAVLPWFEMFCGLLLLVGVAVRGTALTLILLLVPFTALVFRRALAIQAALAIPFCAVKFDCGCGGGEVFVCRKLLENVLCLVAAGCLLAGCGRKFCLLPDLNTLRGKNSRRPD